MNADNVPPNSWLMTPADTLLQYIVDEQTITSVTHRALINVNLTVVLLAKAKAQFPNADQAMKSAFQKVIDISKADVGFVQKEEATGYNRLFSHAAVATWGAIESSIENTLLIHIRRIPNAQDLIRSNAPLLKERDLRRAFQGDEPAVILRPWESSLKDIPTTVAR